MVRVRRHAGVQGGQAWPHLRQGGPRFPVLSGLLGLRLWDGPKPLHVREWTCGECGTVHDRDHNAARNVPFERRRIVAAGRAETLNASQSAGKTRTKVPAQRVEAGSPGRGRRLRPESLDFRPGSTSTVTDNPFLAHFSLDIEGESSRDAQLLRDLPTGLSEWAVHPSLGSEDSQRINSGWRVRRTDYDFLTSPKALALLRQEGIAVIDYSTVQQAWSQPSTPR
jgi:hypothetical protein